MKDKFRRILVSLSGVLFALYAAFYLFILVRDVPRGLPLVGIIISAILIVVFSVLAMFSFTSEAKNMGFRMFRRVTFILAMIIITGLKLRLVHNVVLLIDLTQIDTILYGLAYFLTVIGLIVLLTYYWFIRKTLSLHPKASMAFPIFAFIMFLAAMVVEAVMMAEFMVMLEANVIRTLVSRPIFYLSFMALALYFLYPPLQIEMDEYAPPADDELIKPIKGEYIPPEGVENIIPDSTFIMNKDKNKKNKNEVDEIMEGDTSYLLSGFEEDYIPPEGVENIVPDDSSYVVPNAEDYNASEDFDSIALDDSSYVVPNADDYDASGDFDNVVPDDSSFVLPDDGEYVLPGGAESVPPESTGYIMSDDAKRGWFKRNKNKNQYTTDLIMATDVDDEPFGNAPDSDGYIIDDGKKGRWFKR